MINLSKKLFIPFLILLIIFSKYRNDIHLNFSSYTNELKLYVLNKLDEIKDGYNSHIFQKEEINKLKKENKILIIKNFELMSYRDSFYDLKANLDIDFYKQPDIYISRVISYVKLNDLTTFWIDFKKAKKGLVYGAIDKNGYVIGVVKRANKLVKLYLNSNVNTSYTVYIGKNRVIGSAVGTGSNLFIKFISLRDDIRVGDPIYTRGLDGVFYSGLKVGIIKKIRIVDNFYEAEVKPYRKSSNISYFYIIRIKNGINKVINDRMIKQKEKHDIREKNVKKIKIKK